MSMVHQRTDISHAETVSPERQFIKCWRAVDDRKALPGAGFVVPEIYITKKLTIRRKVPCDRGQGLVQNLVIQMNEDGERPHVVETGS